MLFANNGDIFYQYVKNIVSFLEVQKDLAQTLSILKKAGV
ncbi:hypothetical protein BC751_0214 [Cecembia calidifontis]|uniref:Uncharacterized protein n=1 Tax=Cecembia calidifontis TaxID=1187080 RepID=A0A4Q7P4V0_9BACT|nr:hypothetical protein BC751_0214 [Cecembia calidifontis]